MPTKAGLVWIEKKGSVRYFTEFRQIIKGKHRGMVEVTLPATPSRKLLVEQSAIRRYPVQTQEALPVSEGPEAVYE